MKNILKKFWWAFLVPIGIFILSYVFKKDTSELKKQIAKKKEEIKDLNKEIKKEEKNTENKEEDLNKSIKKTKETLGKNLDDKVDRDEEAKKFFPDI